VEDEETQMSQIRLRRWALGIAGATVAAPTLACTRVELCAIDPETGACREPQPPIADNVVAVEGTACTVDPGWVIFPYKVLFVIDDSRSNQTSDPQDHRADAVQAVIDDYIENRAVSYAVIAFSDSAEKMTDGFTRNYDALVPGVIETLRRDIAGTNYVDTLTLVIDFLRADIERTPEAERHRTRYDIQWLSDGIPDPCQRPEAVHAKVTELAALRAEYGLYDLRLSTARLFHPGYLVAGCEDVTPLDYLPRMAELGHGTFRDFQSASDIVFEIAFTEIDAPFERHHSFPLFVVNENRVVQDGRLWADSDGDGLRDQDDGTEPDPTSADFNLDGCSDRVEDELLPNPPTVCTDLCRQRMDSGEFTDLDGDGLPDCAEQTLGFHILRADTDLDGFTDLLELKHQSSAISDRILVDTDYDGLADGEEIRSGTNPLSPEPDDSLRYRYAPLVPVASDDEGVTCVSFRVDNVRLVETLAVGEAEAQTLAATPPALAPYAAPAHPRGSNEICVYLVQTSRYDPHSEPTITRACKPARYLEDLDLKEPASGVIEIEPRDFRCFTNCQE
jgi:hypothetical protein